MECYSVLKINARSSHEETRRNTTICTLPSENIASERLHGVRFQLQDILEKARLWRWQKDQWSEGGDGAGMDTEHAKDFQGSENTMCTIITTDTCHYAFVQTYGINNIKCVL